MKDLLDRLEAASVGSRELDCLIAVHPDTPEVGARKGAAIAILLMPRAFGISGDGGDADVRAYLPKTNADHFGIPEFTTSLDAALTGLPATHREGMRRSPMPDRD